MLFSSADTIWPSNHQQLSEVCEPQLRTVSPFRRVLMVDDDSGFCTEFQRISLEFFLDTFLCRSVDEFLFQITENTFRWDGVVLSDGYLRTIESILHEADVVRIPTLVTSSRGRRLSHHYSLPFTPLHSVDKNVGIAALVKTLVLLLSPRTVKMN